MEKYTANKLGQNNQENTIRTASTKERNKVRSHARQKIMKSRTSKRGEINYLDILTDKLTADTEAQDK